MSKPSLISLRPVTISAIWAIAPNAFVISFPRWFEFEAGQVVGIGLHAEDDARIYSIASGMHEQEAEILFDIKPEGYLTPKLADCKPGDTIFVSEPFGSFLGTKEAAWWIAAGTGIAPYRSMLRSGFGAGKWMIHGSRSKDNFYFSEEFSAAMGHHYVRCLSKPEEELPSDFQAFKGRVTDFLGTFDLLEKSLQYYLCGSAEMVIDCRELLLEKKVPYGNILAEVYF
jgi:ferredoxin--NADP+ reductase